ncbi:mechanosensitive ion channel family protein [Vulcaniibacterium tengchongense]|uniref:Small-conductance mechanosensitive channel n=1 Tax=Vulcaniibacterium tengchongense TaxID=1273429 RepID=A0A3N4VXF2_9GAMM|nr:mechanosensitive ion channel family protein [Vulcaniibacterium tengchongense]RPE81797.1 small-conductance mechanosensitive channel [Vulcaniibacterium tengchongense]
MPGPTAARDARAAIPFRGILPAALLALALAAGSVAAAPPAPAADATASERADLALSAQVNARLREIEGLERVTATAHGGVARLEGEVLDAARREAAEQAAAQQAGVRAVENRIRVSTRLDDRLDAALRLVGEKLLRLVAALPLLVVALAVVLLAAWLGRRVGGRVRLRHLRHRNPYLDSLVGRLAQWAIVFTGILLALDLLGATTLVGAALGSAGVLGLALGFAFKDIAENYVAGVLLGLRQPFSPGDHVQIENREGKVVALTSRVTVLMTLDGNQLALPNALVFKSVVLNYTQNPHRRFDFAVGVPLDRSVHEAQERALAAIARVPGVLADPAPSWQIDEYAADRIVLRFFGWVDQRRNDLAKARSESIRAVKAAFQDLAAQAETPPPERAGSADTSVNHDIDAQLAAERRAHGERNLLQPKAANIER